MSTGMKPTWFVSLSVPLALKPRLAAFKLALVIALVLTWWSAVIWPGQLGDSCLVSFGFLVTTGLGGLFFVLLHHVLGARWSKTTVIHASGVVELILIAMLFVVPIALRVDESWPWFTLHSAHAHQNSFARAYQRPVFLIARFVVCCAVWLLLGHWYTRAHALDAVRSSSNAVLRRLRFHSGPALVGLALTLTSFSFEWVMPLQRDWHSAVLGVYVFAGGVPAALAMLALTTLGVAHANPSSMSQAKDIRHDLAKLLFGFTIFWAYIAFSQYLLIWYAGIPAEMRFYGLRSTFAWRWLTILLIVFHFVVPFFILLPASAKRSVVGLGLAASSVLIGHWLDWYWLIIPTLDRPGAMFGIADLSMAALCLLGIGLGVLRSIARQPQLVPSSIHLVERE